MKSIMPLVCSMMFIGIAFMNSSPIMIAVNSVLAGASLCLLLKKS